jgi:hypothetical protein
VSPEVSYMISRMMAKDRNERYTTAAMLLKDLNATSEGGRPEGFSDPEGTKRKIGAPAQGGARPTIRRRRRFRR